MELPYGDVNRSQWQKTGAGESCGDVERYSVRGNEIKITLRPLEL